MSRLDRTYLDRLYDENSRDRFYIDVSDRDLYDKVKEELMDTKKNRDLFLFAVAKGFSLKLKKEIEKKEDYLRSEYLSPEDFALLYSIAIHDTGKIEIIEDTETIF
ncbi:MAG TPA: hypothetical protein DER56_06860, partial [Thermosipho africanus]|nr:hypothetical protein [Thermosipho africanus]